MVIHFHLKWQAGMDNYVLDYYDAVLQKEVMLNEVVNCVDITSLEKRMVDIDWRDVFRSTDEEAGSWDEKSLWAEAEAIESIISDLALLKAEGGGELSTLLKLKYWAGTAHQEFTGCAISGRVKAEISQRFFLQEGSFISSDEAYRFLQNRWLEKELQVKQKGGKQGEGSSPEGKGRSTDRRVGRGKQRRPISQKKN